jgi:hypothetical protein
MFEWLCVSVELRQTAVETRKRRPDLYSAESATNDAASETEDIEEEEEEVPVDLDADGELIDVAR